MQRKDSLTDEIGMLKKFITEVTALDEDTVLMIASFFKEIKYKRNSVILYQGEVCREFYYLQSGCVRNYYITRDGSEKTRVIKMAHMATTALTSFISQKPTEEIMDALEDSVLYAISHSNFFKLIQQIPQWERFYRELLESAFVFQSKKIEHRVTLSAKQRYEMLLIEYPEYVMRLSNRIIATYLDMSHETLSRLKSR